MNLIIQDMLLDNKNARPMRKLNSMLGVVIHYVGNPNSSALGNRNFFNTPNNSSSSHYIVGLQGEVIRCIPDDEVSNSAGKSYGTAWDQKAKTNNSTLISIETCHPDATGKFNDKTYAALIELVAELCVKYKFNVDTQVFRHYDVCGKICPMYYVNNPDAWSKMRKDIKDRYNSIVEGNKPQSTPSTVNPIPDKVPSSSEGGVRFNMFSNDVVIEGKIDNGTSYVKVRDFIEELNKAGYTFTVGWDAERKSVVIDNMNISDKEILYRIVQAEAGGEDEEGKMLVVNVIMNRVKSKEFPNTIKEVVFQPNQFEPTRNGAYDKAVVSEATKIAVNKAIAKDLSQGALYFRTVKGADGSWHDKNLTRLFVHGGHVFYK